MVIWSGGIDKSQPTFTFCSVELAVLFRQLTRWSFRFQFCFATTKWDYQMSRAFVSCFERSGDLDLTGLNPDWVKPITLNALIRHHMFPKHACLIEDKTSVAKWCWQSSLFLNGQFSCFHAVSYIPSTICGYITNDSLTRLIDWWFLNTMSAAQAIFTTRIFKKKLNSTIAFSQNVKACNQFVLIDTYELKYSQQ